MKKMIFALGAALTINAATTFGQVPTDTIATPNDTLKVDSVAISAAVDSAAMAAIDAEIDSLRRLRKQYTDENDIIEKRYKVNTAFAPGERLVYNLKYGFAKGGELDVQLGLEPIGYGYLFHAVAHCYTTGLVKKAVYVDDIYESYFDISDGEPIKSIRNVVENRYRRYNEDLFFRDSTVVYSLKSGRHEMPRQVFDIVSAFYYARRFVFDKKFEKNESMNLYTWFNEDLYRIKLRYKKTETVRTNFGKIECLKFVPVIDNDSPFKKEEGMEAWFTNDGNFVPVKILIDLPVSKIKAELQSYENLKNKDGFLK